VTSQNSRGWYNPHWHYDNEPETRAAPDVRDSSGAVMPNPQVLWDIESDAALAGMKMIAHEISEWNTETPVLGATYRAGARSVVVLIAGDGPMAGISNGVQSTPAEPSSRQDGVSASSFDGPSVG